MNIISAYSVGTMTAYIGYAVNKISQFIIRHASDTLSVCHALYSLSNHFLIPALQFPEHLCSVMYLSSIHIPQGPSNPYEDKIVFANYLLVMFDNFSLCVMLSSCAHFLLCNPFCVIFESRSAPRTVWLTPIYVRNYFFYTYYTYELLQAI